jgi:hypothetical protein
MGSIGKKHFDILKTISDNIHVVDPYTKDINSPHGKYLNSLFDLEFAPNPEDIAVISNWGPDHFKTFEQAANLGFKKILLEKPMASSLLHLIKMRELVKNNQILLIVNQGWAHIPVAQKIHALSSLYNLGEPIAVFINGGARCISTAGSHLLHLANSIICRQPLKLISNAHFDYINPRSKNLVYIDGNFSVFYEDRRMVALNFTNLSSISGDIKIYWRDAIGDLSQNFILSLSKRKSNREFSEIITRYGDPDEMLYSSSIFDNQIHSDPQLKAAHNYALNADYDNNNDILDKHFLTNEMLLRLLVSAKLGRIVNFDEPLSDNLINLDFQIS